MSSVNFNKYDLIRSACITEKSSKLNEDGVYVFNVSPSANKGKIKYSIEHYFDVAVESVNTTVLKPKKGRVRGKVSVKRKLSKRAYVKLKEGHVIEMQGGEA
jgi:large subunit ribosomal protein L23